MKDFKHFGVKKRVFPEHNYNALWSNLKTIRLGEGVAKELPPEFSEFYDVSLGNKCITGKCPFCYVSSDPNGRYYENICDTWKKWMSLYPEEVRNGITYTTKPFQIAIGSEGEPTEHPQFCEFIETVYNTNVVPNFTTNGVILASWDNPGSSYYEKANRILDYTSRYVGGVAVSFGNKALRQYAEKAIVGLIAKGNCHINIHHIIYDKDSVDAFVKAWEVYGDVIKYHVLLPLMPSGRSKEGIQEGVFEYLEQKIQELNIQNVAFGAHFVKFLRNSSIKTWLYEPESFSKNVILMNDEVRITPSSFNLNPIKIINFESNSSN